jgi:hypothetical protein
MQDNCFNIKQLQEAFAAIEKVAINVNAVFMSKMTFDALKKFGGSEEGCLVIWNRERLMNKISNALRII